MIFLPSSEYELGQTHGRISIPYYIFAPRWIQSSAGIRVLHLLCHNLNLNGYEAYLVTSDIPFRSQPRVSGDLFTPILTHEQYLSHYEAGINPIVLYSETVRGNPLKAKNVVRYLLNYVGSLGGDTKFNQDEYILAFSKNIARHYSRECGVPNPRTLFLPPVDPSEFTYTSEKQGFQVVYAGKFRSFVGAPPKVGNLPSIEIMREGKEMQSREEVRNLLAKASVLYSFENSSIITEAVLSGTPVILVRNVFFTEVIAEQELGWGGIRYHDEEEALIRAQGTILEGIERYQEALMDFPEHLESFVRETQKKFKQAKEVSLLDLKSARFRNYSHRVNLGFQILRTKGVLVLVRTLFFFFRKRIGLRKLAK